LIVGEEIDSEEISGSVIPGYCLKNSH